MAGIKEDEWFKQDYIPANPEDKQEDVSTDDEALSIHEMVYKLATFFPVSFFPSSLGVTLNYFLDNSQMEQT